MANRLRKKLQPRTLDRYEERVEKTSCAPSSLFATVVRLLPIACSKQPATVVAGAYQRRRSLRNPRSAAMVVSVAADTPKGFGSREPPLQLDQATPGSTCHSFRATDDVHLSEDRFHVRFHGAFADE